MMLVMKNEFNRYALIIKGRLVPHFSCINKLFSQVIRITPSQGEN
jgi:hypothetical protein